MLKFLQETVEEKDQLIKEFTAVKEKNLILDKEVQQLRKHLEDVTEKMVADRQKESEKIALNILQKVFTPGQIKLLMSPHLTRIRWCSEDITAAIALRSLSPKAYRYLREVRKIPLPCETTLQEWCSTFVVKPGILNDVIRMMEEKGLGLSKADKITVLTFYEVYIFNKLDLERKEQKIYGPHKTCQFVMARGLFNSWKQPVYYDFDQQMTKKILFEIVQELYNVGYTVVALTCDMGTRNMALWKDLNIGVNIRDISSNLPKKQKLVDQQCYFEHPANLKVFCFADVPHLIKSARNNLFDSGFHVDGEFINTDCLEELLTLNAKDLKITHKLSRRHLDVQGVQRQNVSLAVQIFSLLNASSIKWYGSQGLLRSQNWRKTADVLEAFNDWFDVFNTYMKYGKHSGLRGYGVNLNEQNRILDNMSHLISEMRVGKRRSLMQFQKGILLCNMSLKSLFQYLQDNFSSDSFKVEYILTRRLNQDVLENFFSYIRSMGAANTHPTPVELRNRLKWYVLGKYSGHVISRHENTKGDEGSISLISMEDSHGINSITHPQEFSSQEFLEDELSTEKCLFLTIPGLSEDLIAEEVNEVQEEEEEEIENNEEHENAENNTEYSEGIPFT